MKINNIPRQTSGRTRDRQHATKSWLVFLSNHHLVVLSLLQRHVRSLAGQRRRHGRRLNHGIVGDGDTLVHGRVRAAGTNDDDSSR